MSEVNQLDDLELIQQEIQKKRYKVDFLNIFIFCLGIMIIYQVMLALDKFPPLFKGADIIYHIISNIWAVITQFASSTAAAIIFYYIIEFFNAKKKMRVLTDIRKHLYFLLYSHMDIIRYTNPFDCLNRNIQRLATPALYLIFDIPFLEQGYNKYVEYDKEIFKEELLSHFINIGKEETIIKFCRFRKDVNDLCSYREYSCYKGFFDDIDNLEASHKELSLEVDLYFEEDNFEYISNNIDDYIMFLDECVMLYSRLEKFIMSINKKQIYIFIKMLQ